MPVVQVSRRIAAPPPDIWRVLSDIENASRWNERWTQVEITSPQRHGEGTTFRARLDDETVFEFEVTGWDPGRLIAFAPIRDDDEGYAISLQAHVFEIEDAGDGASEVRLTAIASTRGLKGAILGRFLWPGYQKHGMEQALASLAALFEPEEAEDAGDGASDEDDEPGA
jgi:uncharacterized protein YndB with AHSA1/START domain